MKSNWNNKKALNFHLYKTNAHQKWRRQCGRIWLARWSTT